MRNEELLLVMKDLVFQTTNLLRQTNSQNDLLKDLLNKGLIFEKKVSRFAQASGAIYVPRALAGKSFRVILIPRDDCGYLGELPKRAKHAKPEVEVEVEEVENEVDNEIRKRLI
jgi:hypothetical protein